MSQRDLVAELLTAIDIVTESHMKNLQYDITKNCTVYDDSDAQNGHYIVTDGSIRFSAYSESTSYKKDDSVRVLVPSGDYTQKKYITGKAVSDNDTAPITYMSPLETTLDMSGNLMGSNEIFGLAANGDIEYITIWQMKMSDSRYKDLQNNGIYDTISLRADFKSLLSNYKMYDGNYGLRLTAYIAPIGSAQATSTLVSYLDSSKMYGNPYSFSVYSTQELKIDIGQMGNVRRLVLDFYQKKNFTHYTSNGNRDVVPVTKDYQGTPINNLFVKNIFVGFGSDLTKITSNTLKLFTEGEGEYNKDENAVDERVMSFLWYNMDDDGRYIGFSDGIYGPVSYSEGGPLEDYDEFKYQELAKINARLEEQAGKEIPLDERGMELSADVEDLSAVVDNIESIITKDLKSQIEAYWRKIDEIADEPTSDLYIQFDTLVKAKDGGLIYEVSENMFTQKMILLNYWKDALKSAYTLHVKGPYDNKILDLNKAQTAEQEVRVLIDNILKAVKQLLATSKSIIKENHGGFMSIYDSYESRIQKVINKIEEQYNSYKELINDSVFDDLEAYFDDYVYKPYTITPLENYSNRYCIYWYRYAPEEADDSPSFMPYGWVLTATNIGLSGESEDTPGYHAPKADNTDVLRYVLDKQKENEKFAVVLFYNHTQYTSEELEFTNVNPPIDPAIQALVGSAFIEHDPNSESRSSYQVYDINNSLVNMSDAVRSRKIRARFIDPGQESINDLTDASLAGAQIFWYVPTVATMLNYDLKDLKTADGEDKFSNDLSGPAPDSREGYVCFYRQIRENTHEDKTNDESKSILSEDRYFTYRIKDYYLPTSTNNTIICVIRKGDVNYEAEIEFNFSSYGTSGTDYTLTVHPEGLRTTASPSEDLNLRISLFDYNNSLIPIKQDADYSYNEATIESIKWHGSARNEVLSLDSVNPVYQADGTVVITILNGMFHNDYYNVLETSVRLAPDSEGSRKSDTVLSVLSAIPYSNGNEDQYVIDGVSHIIYDASGGSPSYYKDPYILYERDGAYEWIESENVDWEIIPYYYDDDGVLLQDTEGNPLVPDILKAFTPALNDKNKIVPANFYVDGTQENIHCVATASIEGALIWAQPIVIMQNRYPSAMLNSWDGSLQIDEENGTILSTMVGAGKKNANNQFEGVLMGDVIGSAEDDSSGIGLFGYNEGAQSFAFNVDGTAHIGKSGRGRIYFDGNSGTISSASWEQTKRDEKDGVIQSAGMMIDLDDGWIELRGASVEGDGSYKKSTNSLVRFDVMAPYATIDSQKGNHLLFIGDATPRIYGTDGLPIKNEFTGRMKVGDGYDASKHGFYLQSDNYDPDGDGMKIDLEEGYIDAFNFSLNSNHFKINSMGNEWYPYMNVTDENNDDLIKIYEDGFLIQSADKEIILSSGFPLSDYYLKIGISDYNEPLMEVGDNLFALRTANFNNSNEGMEIDLQAGTITAYDGFYLKATNNGNSITISSRPGDNPLTIGSNFSVDWDGSVTANWGTFNNIAITSGSININDKFIVLSSGDTTIHGGLTVDGTTSISNNVGISGTVTVGGNVGISGIITVSGSAGSSIAGWSFNDSSISKGHIVLDGSGSGSISTAGGYFSVDGSSGLMTAKDSVIENLTVKKKLSVIENATLEVSGDGYFTGLLGIGVGAPGASGLAKYNLVVGGATHIMGDLDIDSNTTIDGTTDLIGQLYVNGTAAFGLDTPTTVVLDVPWSVTDAELTFQNGILISCTAPQKDGSSTSKYSAVAFKDNVSGTGTNGQVLKALGGSKYAWATISASLVNFSNTTVSAADSSAGVYNVSITGSVSVPKVSEDQTVYLYTYTQPSSTGYFSTYETTGSPPAGSYWTRITRDIANGTTTTSKTLSGKVQVKVSV